MRIIGYTYEASVNCVDCTNEMFPNPDKAVDREGNEVHPVYDIDDNVDEEYCDTCFE